MSKQLDYIKKYLPYALEIEKKHGISALFLLAQSALESGYGNSKPGNMMFGIKATKSTPESKKQLLRTTEILNDDKQSHRFPEVISIEKLPTGKYRYIVRDWFRKYDSPAESFADHAKFLQENRRYATALNFKNEPYKLAEEIARAGYATVPDYATRLKNTIKILEPFFLQTIKTQS